MVNLKHYMYMYVYIEIVYMEFLTKIYILQSVPYSGYISFRKMFVLSRTRDFRSFYFCSEQPFVHMALREHLFCLKNIHSTRSENEKNEIKLERNIPAIWYIYQIKLLVCIMIKSKKAKF